MILKIVIVAETRIEAVVAIRYSGKLKITPAWILETTVAGLSKKKW